LRNTLNIQAQGLDILANKLEKINRSAFPVAVRQTLNSAAFDLKQNTMPQITGSLFVKRKPNFFKANSKVFPAKGFEVKNMRATAGFVGKDQAIDDLEQQEIGGRIKSRSFIALDTARVSKSPSKSVRPNARLANAKIINSTNGTGTRRQQFVRAAIKAHQQGALLIGNFDDKTVFRVDDITPSGIGGAGIVMKLTPLYSYKQGRSVQVGATGFMQKSANKTAPKIVGIFANHAENQFKRIIK
jgi:hypothetical protein